MILCNKNFNSLPLWDMHVPITSPTLKYGIGLFEGVASYFINHEMQILYLDRHLKRLQEGVKTLRLDYDFDIDRIAQAVQDTIFDNRFQETVHTRISLLLEGDGEIGAKGPVSLYIIPTPLSQRNKSKDNLSVQISMYKRPTETSMPMRIKSIANYHNSRLGLIQANYDGYDSCVFLNDNGKVTEGPGCCIFIVKDHKISTPSLSSGILPSITRQTIISNYPYNISEREIDYTELLQADEAFFVGTSTEVKRIHSINGHVLNGGTLCERIKSLYEKIIYYDSTRLNRN